MKLGARISAARARLHWDRWFRAWGRLGFAAGSDLAAREYAAGRNW